jgi:hypothetical protein
VTALEPGKPSSIPLTQQQSSETGNNTYDAKTNDTNETTRVDNTDTETINAINTIAAVSAPSPAYIPIHPNSQKQQQESQPEKPQQSIHTPNISVSPAHLPSSQSDLVRIPTVLSNVSSSLPSVSGGSSTGAPSISSRDLDSKSDLQQVDQASALFWGLSNNTPSSDAAKSSPPSIPTLPVSSTAPALKSDAKSQPPPNTTEPALIDLTPDVGLSEKQQQQQQQQALSFTTTTQPQPSLLPPSLEFKPLTSWTTSDVIQFLQTHQFSTTVLDLFADRQIDGPTLRHISVDALRSEMPILDWPTRARIVECVYTLLESQGLRPFGASSSSSSSSLAQVSGGVNAGVGGMDEGVPNEPPPSYNAA